MPDNSFALVNSVNRLNTQVVALNNSVDSARAEVAAVSHQQAETRNDLAALRDQLLAFARRQDLANNLQRSTTEAGNLKSDLQRQFGLHEEVRNTAVGIMQAFDAGMLAEEALFSLSSQLMIKTPRYWLAPILGVLEAWAADDVERCTTAVNEAFHRDPAKTSLFMALVLRRQGRHASAVRWLRQYLLVQDPSALGRDFAVILESIAQGAFGPGALTMMQDLLAGWRTNLAGDDERNAAQVARWRQELAGHVGKAKSARYPRLAGLSPEWPQLNDVLRHAGAHQSVLAKYTEMMAAEIVPEARLEDQVDDILDRLVRGFDDDELPLRRRIAYHEAIIRHEGDDLAAQRDIALESNALEDTKDYLTVQSESALNPAGIGVSRSTQRMAVAACHEWFAAAHGGFTRDYRAALPQNVRAEFKASHNLGATTFQLPTWTGSFTEPMDRLERSLGQHWDRHTGPFLEGLKFNWGAKLVLPIVVTLATLILMACNVALGVIAFIISAGVWALVLFNQHNQAQETRNRFEALIRQARVDSLAQLRGAGAELTDWASEFQRADAMEAQVRGLIQHLATAGQPSTPYARRHADGRTAA